MSTNSALVLDVGAGERSVARSMWPDATVRTLDADPALKPDVVGTLLSIPEPDDTYDAVVASHVLEHVEYRDATTALKEMRRVVKLGGEVHILVPSLEWAARQILGESMSPVTIPHIYGLQTTPWQYHKAGFRLADLRDLMTSVGLRVVVARRAVYHVSGVDRDGKTVGYPAEQHYVVGRK